MAFNVNRILTLNYIRLLHIRIMSMPWNVLFTSHAGESLKIPHVYRRKFWPNTRTLKWNVWTPYTTCCTPVGMLYGKNKSSNQANWIKLEGFVSTISYLFQDFKPGKFAHLPPPLFFCLTDRLDTPIRASWERIGSMFSSILRCCPDFTEQL